MMEISATTKVKLLLEEYDIQLLPYYHGGKGIYGVHVKGPEGEAKIGIYLDVHKESCALLNIFVKALILSHAYAYGGHSTIGFVSWVASRVDSFFLPRIEEEESFHLIDVQYKRWNEGIELADKLIAALTEDVWRMLLNSAGSK